MKSFIANVQGQTLSIIDHQTVSDTIDYFTATFSFSSDWDNMQKWCHFRKNNTTFDVLLKNDKILSTDSVNLDSGTWEVYLHGNRFDDGEVTQRVTTSSCYLKVIQSSILGGEPFPTVPASAGEQIIAQATEQATSACQSAKMAKSHALNAEDALIEIRVLDEHVHGDVNAANSIYEKTILNASEYEVSCEQKAEQSAERANAANESANEARVHAENAFQYAQSISKVVGTVDRNTEKINDIDGIVGNAVKDIDKLKDESHSRLVAGQSIEIVNNVVSVVTTDDAEEDNTLPITSSAVHTIVGNIDTLLSLI